jgi:hypothetical protein
MWTHGRKALNTVAAGKDDRREAEIPDSIRAQRHRR